MAAEIPDGAVIIARAILNSSLWTMRTDDRCVAITCICLCNWQDRKWFDGKREIVIHRGQFVRSLKDLAKSAGVTPQVLRTAIKHLENTRDNDGVPFLTRISTHTYTIYTIHKYHYYQDLMNYSDSAVAKPTRDPTNGQHTPNTRLTHAQHTPNNKQELEEGKERKELEEARSAATATPPPAAAPATPEPKTRDEIVASWLAKIPEMSQKSAGWTLDHSAWLISGMPEVVEALERRSGRKTETTT